MSKKYYRESVGECVSQVYELDATTWEDAKKEAFDAMDVNDVLAECEPDAVIYDGDYASIDEDNCSEYAKLQRGTWCNRPNGSEYWEAKAWYFSDQPDTYYNGDFEEFTDWDSNCGKDDFEGEFKMNEMNKVIPDWVCPETMIDSATHPKKEAWVESHEHPETGEKIYLALDTSGCDQGIIGVFDNEYDAENAVGEQAGFDEFWVKW